MRKRSAPPREPISDQVTGVLTRVDGSILLSAADLQAGKSLHRGGVILRYGITYLGKPYRSIVPDLVVADYGELLTGEAAWSFLMESGHLYPRADIIGIRNDGEEDMLALKLLDFDYPYDVFAYRSLEERQPFVKVTAAIVSDQTLFPPRLLRHLPHFLSLRDWRNRA